MFLDHAGTCLGAALLLAAGCGGVPPADGPATAAPTVAADLTCGDDVATMPVRDGLSPLALSAAPARAELAAWTLRAASNSAADRALARALVRCALPAGARLFRSEGAGSACLPGQLGLSPAFATGACDDTCQQRLSGCAAALLNRDGRGARIAVTTPADPQPAAMPLQEARFYGDLFRASGGRLYACAGTDAARLPLARRTCATDGSCGVTPTGACADVCTAAGCRDDQGRVWAHPVTAWLDDRLDAVAYDAAAGVVAAGGVLREVDDGDWVSFRDVDFGAPGSVSTFAAWITTPNLGNQIEAWADGTTGTYLGTLLTQPTRDGAGRLSEAVESVRINAAALSGRHTVYIHFDGPENAAAWNGRGQDIGWFSHFRFR